MADTSVYYKELDTIRSFKVLLTTGISRASQLRFFADLLVQHGLVSEAKANEVITISAYSDYDKISELLSALYAMIEIASNQERATKIFDLLIVILHRDIGLKDLAEQLVKHRGKNHAVVLSDIYTCTFRLET